MSASPQALTSPSWLRHTGSDGSSGDEIEMPLVTSYESTSSGDSSQTEEQRVNNFPSPRREMIDPEFGYPLMRVEIRRPGPTSYMLTRSERMQNEVITNKCVCPICHDEIISTLPMWPCEECYQIYHFNCIEKWSKRNPRSWSCPTCNSMKVFDPEARCWCRRVKHDTEKLHPGNSCGMACGRIRRCNGVEVCMELCRRLCHPGACDPPICSPSCSLLKLPEPAIATSAPSRQDGLHHAWNGSRTPQDRAIRPSLNGRPAQVERPQDIEALPNPPRRQAPRPSFAERWHDFNTTQLAGELILLIPPNFSLGVWAYFNIFMWTDPLDWVNFTESSQPVATGLAILSSLLLFIWNLTLCTWLGIDIRGETFKLFRLDRPSLSLGKGFSKLVIMTAIVALIVAAVFWFPTIFFGGPRIVYYHQQKGSCHGYDARVSLSDDTPNKLPSHLITLGASQFQIASISQSTYNYRVTDISSLSDAITIEFNLEAHTWQIFSLPPNGGISNNISSHETLVRNGTWPQTTESSPHAHFPELELMITNLYFFGHDCRYQPYTTAFRTSDMTNDEMTKVPDVKWKKSSDSNTVLRTASFGNMPGAMEVCIKQADYGVKNGKGVEEVKRGLGEDAIVSVALLAAIGKSMRDTGRYNARCSWQYV